MLRRRSDRACSRRYAVPPKWDFTTSPLQLKPMRARPGRASSEIEAREAFVDCATHAFPVEQHVRRMNIELPKRRCPGHLKLTAEAEATSCRDRLVLVIRACKPAIVRELVSNVAKEF